MLNNIYFNNKDFFKDFNSVLLEDYTISSVIQVVEHVEVEGSNFGTLTQKLDSYNDIEFACNIKLLDTDYNRMNEIEKCLNNIQDNRLFLASNKNKCLRVKYAKSEGYSKKYNIIREVPVKFICEPFWFDTVIEEIELSNNDKFMSDTDISYPVTGKVQCKGNTSIIINGTELRINHNGLVIIDGNRGICYTEDRTLVKHTGEIPNVISGDNNYSTSTSTVLKLEMNNRYFV